MFVAAAAIFANAVTLLFAWIDVVGWTIYEMVQTIRYRTQRKKVIQ
jgi:hypothetical protein